VGDTKAEQRIGEALASRGLTLAVAESCTGGLLGHLITSVPGSSEYFLGGVISYSDEAKAAILAVPRRVLKIHGAVSLFTAEAMARGARRLFGASVALAITGIAGPGGGSQRKPVGLTYIALSASRKTVSRELILPGDRAAVKSAAAKQALALLIDYLESGE
jgi:PncC family amidohydrolase